LQEKCLLGRVAFREDMVVIEKTKSLRELERILGDEGRFLRSLVDLEMKSGSNGSRAK